MTSSCHRIKIYSMNKSRKETRERLALFEKKGLDIKNLSYPEEIQLEDEEEYLSAVRSHNREPEN